MWNCLRNVLQACGHYTGGVQPFIASSITRNLPSKSSIPLYKFSTMIQREPKSLWNGPVCVQRATSPWFLNSETPTFQPNRSYFFERKIIMEKASMKDGKRTTVEMVPERFFRLHWGMWIRRLGNSKRKMWAKNTKRYKNAKRHFTCSIAQCRLLDKMVGPSYRKRTYFVDDPYEPYHKREEFLATRRAPVDIPPRL